VLIITLIKNAYSIQSNLQYDSDPTNFTFLDLKETPFLGTKSHQFTATIKSHGGDKSYTTSIVFYGVEDGEKTDSSKHEVRVSCSCKSHYFYFAHWNEVNKAHFGPSPTPYKPLGVRKPVNPSKLPGACKHVIGLYKLLVDSDKVIE